jgi:hypothetical protein
MLSCRTTAVLRRLALRAHHHPTTRRIVPVGTTPSSSVGIARVRLFSEQQKGTGSSIPSSNKTASSVLDTLDNDDNDDTFDERRELGDGDGFSSSYYSSAAEGDEADDGDDNDNDEDDGDEDDDDEDDDDNYDPDGALLSVDVPVVDSLSQPQGGLFCSGEPPLWELNEFYKTQHGISNVSKQIQADLVQEYFPVDHWAASFTCPVTGTDFYPAGVLRSDRDDAKRKPDGRIVYLKKSTAMRAAAARALDVIQYQKLGIVEPRLCEEDPSLWGKEVIVETANGVGPSAVTSKISSDSQALHNSDEPATITDKGGNKIVSNDTTDESDEYVLWEIPRNNGRPPYQRIVEALSNTASAPPLTTSENPILPIPLNPDQQLHLAIDNAYSWLNQMNSLTPLPPSPHRLVLPRQETPSTLLMGKILLSAMADAVQNTAFDEKSYGAENAAIRILDVLWETKDSKPDTDAYTSYLRCVHSFSPKAIAAKAERIVENMRAGTPRNGWILPKPNTGTTNALIQLWSQVGGTSGRYAAGSDEDFIPDRESFLSVLSSSTYKPSEKDEKGGFDPEFARQCIQRMKELVDEDPANVSLRPDTQIYNAPLPWSGGLAGRKTRPYARFIPWDHYQKMFANGFRVTEEDDDLVREARSMEEWMEEMASHEDDAVTPDIETYEAVIQAWVRVGSRAGLERAESLAETLLSDLSVCSARPRLQTFHPILCAWMHSKDPESAVKFQKWVERLEEASDLIPAVRPDGRILGAQITAHVSSQLLLLHGLGDTPGLKCDDESRDKIFFAANACNETLEKQRAFLEQGAHTGAEVDRILEVHSFAHTVIAWSNVALANQSIEQTEQFEDALSQMVRVIDSFESLVATLFQAETERQSKQATTFTAAGLQTQRELSLQLRHMVVNAHRIYSAFTIGFRRLQNGQRRLQSGRTTPQDGSDEGQYNPFVRHIYFVERMLRRVGEFYEIEAHDLSLKMRRSEKAHLFQNDFLHETAPIKGSRSMTYADLFCYQSPDELYLPSRPGFLFEVASFLKESPLSLVPAGDIMRLALLIKDVGNRSTTRPKVEYAIADLVGYVLEESIQLRSVRRPQQASLSKFVQESMQLERSVRHPQQAILVKFNKESMQLERDRSLPQGSDVAGGSNADGIDVSSQRSPPRAQSQVRRQRATRRKKRFPAEGVGKGI